MVYYMNSKTFFEIYLQEERYKTIKNAQYICVSTNIRKRNDAKNIITVSNAIYPRASVFNKGTEEEMRTAYLKQLDGDDKSFIASVINEAITKDLDVVFLCTEKEWKLDYLKWLSEYVYMAFEFPIYDYKKYKRGYVKTRLYEKEKVLKKTKKIVKRSEKEIFEEWMKNERGRKRILQEFKNKSKKEIIKFLKKNYVYYPGKTKREMLDDIEFFIGA